MKALGKKNGVAHLKLLGYEGDDAALVRTIQRGDIGACAALYDQHIHHVQKVITRIMGVDQELSDLTNIVFYQAIKSIHRLNDPLKLKAWVTQIAVFTARRCIRARKRRRWLRFGSASWLQDLAGGYEMDVESGEIVSLVRKAMEGMSVEEHLCFSLRYFQSMELQEIAEACGCSIRTAKRRLAKGEKRFKRSAMGYPELATRLEGSEKWRAR